MATFVTPAAYADRYLPVIVRGPDGRLLNIKIDRYHIGPPSTNAKDLLWAATGEHFKAMKEGDPGYRLEININNIPTRVGSREEIRWPLINPFFGKGSPEEVQIALQLALRFKLATPERLQAWADANIGLDCNGYVGNYIIREILGNPWFIHPGGNKTPAPSAAISAIFEWAAGGNDSNALHEISQIDANVPHLFARVDASGHVMPGGSIVGHVGLTEPGMKMNQSFVSNSMGGIDLKTAQQGPYGKFALRSVESAGQVSGGAHVGLSQNWLIFIGKRKGFNNVFEVMRDNIRITDYIKITPVPGWT